MMILVALGLVIVCSAMLLVVVLTFVSAVRLLALIVWGALRGIGRTLRRI